MKMHSGMRTPLARARALGSTNTGAHHWMVQRLTSIALVPLSIWFVFSVVSLLGVDHATFQLWLGNHFNTVMMSLFVITLFHHAQQGVCEVIHEYVHVKANQLTAVIIVKFLAFFLAVSCLTSIIRVASGG